MISSTRWQVIQWRMKTTSILSATDPLEKLIEWLLPASLGLRMHQLIATSDELRLIMASSRSEACCPLCKQQTERMHSRYTRTLQDLPWGTLRVQVQVQVHRFFCQNPTCPRKIFTEPIPDSARRSDRRTNRLREALLANGWPLGGQARARQCLVPAMPLAG